MQDQFLYITRLVMAPSPFRLQFVSRLSARLSYWLIPALTSLAMAAAFFLAPKFPALESILKPYAKYNLSILLLINALHINYRSVSHLLLRRPLLLTYAILAGNVLLPILVSAVCRFVWPSALPAAVLLGGTSSGFSAVSFAILLRLAPELNLLITLGASLLVPFSLPILLYLLASSSVEIDLAGMMLQMAWIIFTPVLCERGLFWGLRRAHSWLKAHSQPIVAFNLSVTAFILMLSGQAILRREAARFAYILAFSLFMVALIYILTLLLFCRATLETQLIMLTANMVSNTGLAMVQALEYLDDITIAIAIIFSIIWNFNIIFLRAWPPLRKFLLQKCLGRKQSEENLL